MTPPVAADATNVPLHHSQTLGEGERHPELNRMLPHPSMQPRPGLDFAVRLSSAFDCLGRIGIELLLSVTGEAEAGSVGEQPAEESPVGDSLRWTGADRNWPAPATRRLPSPISSSIGVDLPRCLEPLDIPRHSDLGSHPDPLVRKPSKTRTDRLLPNPGVSFATDSREEFVAAVDLTASR
jgi:hypothetical protein